MGFSQGDFIQSEKGSERVEFKRITLSETNFFTEKILLADCLFLKSFIVNKNLSHNFKMETVLTNAYTCLGQKSKPFKTNSIAIGTKELLQRKIYVKKRHFFTKGDSENFINRVIGSYEIIWKTSACIKRKFYCFREFT